MAIFRAPQARPGNGRRIVSTAAGAEIERIERLLSGEETGPVGDDAIAERDRAWAQQNAAEQRQCTLRLEVSDDGQH